MIWDFFRSLFGLNKDEEIEDSMKYLIVGLGNIGPKYVGTRHNIGFEALDFIQEQLGGEEFEVVNLGALAHCKYKGRHIYLLKPSTYVNLSGKAVRYWMQKKKVKLDNVLIILDDLNLPFGKTRMRKKGGDGGHNGLKNIQQVLATSQYARLRIGIGDEFHKGAQVNFVLGKWTDAEITQLSDILTHTTDSVKAFVTMGLERAMNQFN